MVITVEKVTVATVCMLVHVVLSMFRVPAIDEEMTYAVKVTVAAFVSDAVGALHPDY